MQPDTPRIATIDLVRGVAVMGILLMNVQSFAMPEAAYLNPAAYGGAHGWNLAVWATELVLVDGKMRGLFSWLFGASLLLVTDRAGTRAAQVHYRRMGWLLVFGLAHLVLVWDGDILVHYAAVGAVAFAFRRRPAHALVAAAIALIVLQLVLSLDTPLAADQIAAEIAGGHPSSEALHDWPLVRDQFGVPAPATIAHQIALHRGSYAGLVADRVAEAPRLVLGTLWSVGLETLAYMLLGMAALKGGMLTGGWSRRGYARTVAIGFGIGVPLGAALAWWVIAQRFDPRAVAWEAETLSAPLRPPMIAGWIALIVLLLRPAGAIGSRVAAAGRMAFSNYLGTSLICAGAFDGLGLFGRFTRVELLAVVAAVWLAMLLWSQPWLARFRYGPMEWAWRSLARWRLEPMRGGAG
ncbi:DUF418 domain-containing protein [uncultured Sphingomonas sp.]|uniref:DUF418 domain-containing protein n=1 Tax=uncultured Sphingomonas sp. TaxID=158754 RepID=UPI0035CC6162